MNPSLPDVPAPWRFGPWAEHIDPVERRCRLRALRLVARVLCGVRAAALVDRLAEAEHTPAAIVDALDELLRLAPRDRRRVIASGCQS